MMNHPEPHRSYPSSPREFREMMRRVEQACPDGDALKAEQREREWKDRAPSRSESGGDGGK